MTDRELLELAAKAAGIKLRWIQGSEDEECVHPIRRREDGMCEVDWLPLTDDGDALRLAVACDMLVEIEGHTARSVTKRGDHEAYQTSGDPYAATRRAIVRAAAEIGKGMK